MKIQFAKILRTLQKPLFVGIRFVNTLDSEQRG